MRNAGDKLRTILCRRRRSRPGAQRQSTSASALEGIPENRSARSAALFEPPGPRYCKVRHPRTFHRRVGACPSAGLINDERRSRALYSLQLIIESGQGHKRKLGRRVVPVDGGRRLANFRLCGRPEVGMKTNFAEITSREVARACMVLRHAASSLFKTRASLMLF